MNTFPMEDPSYARTYAKEAAMVDASETIAEALEASGMNRSQLASALGVSRSEITARLQGERNITVRKLAETLHVLGASLDIGLKEPKSGSDDVVLMAWARLQTRGLLSGRERDVRYGVAELDAYRGGTAHAG